MANEKNKLQVLVSEDDDPTEEFEALPMLFPEDAESESGASTSGLRPVLAAKGSESIADLKSDLESRSQTISRLQYDIEQLRSRWMGLETEIGVREEIAVNLNRELAALRESLVRKDELISERNEQIEALQAEVRERSEDQLALSESVQLLHEEIEQSRIFEKQHDFEKLQQELAVHKRRIAELDEQNAAYRERLDSVELNSKQQIRQLEEQSGQLVSDAALIQELRSQRARSEEYADLLRQQIQDEQATWRTAIDTSGKLQTALSLADEKSAELSSQLQLEVANKAAMQQQLDDLQSAHDAEIRTLRQEIQDEQAARRTVEDANGKLQTDLSLADEKAAELGSQLQLEVANNAAMQQQLDDLQRSHEVEIRTLRFELGEAQDTVTESARINEEIAANLVETHSYSTELEKILSEAEEANKARIVELEKENAKLLQEAQDREEKLQTKSEAITGLMAELTRKNEQIASIGEIENVIQEIDDRMSERIDWRPAHEKDRITRVLTGSVDGQELRFPLFKDRLTIGRTDQNDIQLKAAYVSRRHAEVVIEGDATWVKDWGSKNGVFVNSERITEKILANGDVVAIGTAKFRYEERPKRDT